MKTLASFGFLAVVASLVGCAVEPAAEPTPESSDSDLSRATGIVLRGLDDADLEITLKAADGIQERTKNQRFIRLTAKRGAKAFGMWCTGGGQFGEGRGKTQSIDCEEYARTVSDDDNESFSLSFTKWEDGSYSISSIQYFGDGTFLGDRVKILSEERLTPDSIDLQVVKGATSTANPFEQLADVGARVEGVLGTELANRAGKKLPVQWVRYSVSNEMEVSAVLALDLTDSRSTNAVSLLETPGTLASGLASAATVKSRVLGAVR